MLCIFLTWAYSVKLTKLVCMLSKIQAEKISCYLFFLFSIMWQYWKPQLKFSFDIPWISRKERSSYHQIASMWCNQLHWILLLPLFREISNQNFKSVFAIYDDVQDNLKHFFEIDIFQSPSWLWSVIKTLSNQNNAL